MKKKVDNVAEAVKKGRLNLRCKKRSGRSSIQTEEIVEHVNRKLGNGRRFSISALVDEFPFIGRTSI